MDIFDNTKPNIIMIADVAEPLFMQKSCGITRVASELRQAGYEVALLNHLHVFEYEELKYILSNLISDQTLFVGVSNFFYRDLSGEFNGKHGEVFWPLPKPGQMVPHGLKYNKDFKDHIKSLNPNCKLVIGGPIAGDGEYNREYDYVLQGYADCSSVNLANHLANGEPLKSSRRSIWGFTLIDDIRAEGFDITQSKTVVKDYDCVLPGETTTIEIARGCVFKCAFCSYPFNGKSKNDFIRSEELIYQEMVDNYEKFGVTRYIFSDDTFNDSPEKAYMINRVSKRLPFDLEFWAYTRIDLLAKHIDTVEQLVEAGQRGMYFGIETWNKKSGEVIGKGLAKEKQIEALRYLKDRWGDQLMLHGNFIVGLPHETPESVQATADALCEPDFPLDSALFLNFTIENTQNFTFNSEIALNPEKFGYKIVQTSPITLEWENEHFTYQEAIDLTKKLNAQVVEKINRVNGLQSFYIANIGFDLDFSRNKQFSEFAWNSVWNQKQKRGTEYRNAVYNKFNINPFKRYVPEQPLAESWYGKQEYERAISPGMEIFGKK